MSSSGLFANQRETNLASTLSLVEAALGELGHNAARSRVEDPAALHAWQITQGSASSRVILLERPEFTHIRVSSFVMTMDAKIDRPALFSHLLELNAGLCGAAFALDGDRVLLVSERSTLDIDRSEVLDLIKRVATYSDDHDDVLVARFGGKMGAR
jgi:hypothetical protein